MIKSMESKRQAEKKRKRNQWIIGGILIFVMFGSVFGIIVNSFGSGGTESGRVEYNGYTFLNQNGYWMTTLGNYQFAFAYPPSEVQRINASGIHYISTYSGAPLYIFSEDYSSQGEIYNNLGNIVQRFQGACINETNCPENWPVKDCSNNFIIIKLSNDTPSIRQEENCVFIEAPQSNITQATDEFLFLMTGIEK